MKKLKSLSIVLLSFDVFSSALFAVDQPQVSAANKMSSPYT
ncbi:hypothetical protein [Terribacillus saccharophilus]|jgi:hypothetical protein|nr:hypothetical protein [Terribacillus saccharophilus]